SGGKGKFTVKRRKAEDGDTLVYDNIAKLKEDYLADKLTPQLLKPAIIKALQDLLQPLQAEYEASVEWQEIANKAYPPPEVKKKDKKAKDRGTKFPGAKGGVEAKPDGHVEGNAQDQVNLGTDAEEAMDKLDIQPKAPS
ncbi:MAG: hypothetical protein Q9224_007423, partial [Gallowayella concinna]